MEYWAVIPSRSRRKSLGGLVERLILDGTNVVIVDNGYDPPLTSASASRRIHVVRDMSQPQNISRWWNIGLDHVDQVRESDAYAVAIINDDVETPESFVQNIAQRMWDRGAALAYPNQHNAPHDILHREPGPIDLTQRIVGYAFVLDGRRGIRADEQLEWWYGDDDLDWTARTLGGSLLVHDVKVNHLSPNGWQAESPNLVTQTVLDRERFLVKWGRTPW